ncbi:hypothetical protein AVEN_201192-1 [Araneus ventricosus]|uniref:Uncharacterized protein n=1 Tax=Araneus ventricosus TaxID=182803 RepID=A0A4Y2VT19_ARAVE|nr:hypothetical protein AVEN_201192-1 [Araneus ventricosus]
MGSRTWNPPPPKPRPFHKATVALTVIEKKIIIIVFYSSRKLRIRTKCSRCVDALLSPGQHSRAFKYQPEESDRNPTSLGNQVLPSVRQDASENQQLPSGVSAETSFRPSVPTSASSSQALNIDQLDETFSSRGVFYFSRDLRIRTICSRSVDALLSPRQNRSGRVDALYRLGKTVRGE